MSDVRAVNDLIRRRNLAATSKYYLIDKVMELEDENRKLNEALDAGQFT